MHKEDIKAFFDAINAGDLQEVQRLASKEPKLISVKIKDNNPLYQAIVRKNSQMVNYFLQEMKNQGTLDEIFRTICNKGTPLHHAIRTEQKDIVQSLVNYGVDIEFPVKGIEPPLELAQRKGLSEIQELLTKALIEQAAKHESKRRKLTSLTQKSEHLHEPSIAEISKQEYAEKHKNEFFQNVTSKDDVEAIRKFNELSSNIESNHYFLKVKNDEGKTVLRMAVEKENDDLVKYLVSKPDSYINEVDILTGGTALHLAVLQGNEEIVRHLLSNPNLDVNIQDGMGQTAKQIAESFLAEYATKESSKYKKESSELELERAERKKSLYQKYTNIINMLGAGPKPMLSERNVNNNNAYEQDNFFQKDTLTIEKNIYQISMDQKIKDDFRESHKKEFFDQIRKYGDINKYLEYDESFINIQEDKTMFTPLHYAVMLNNIDLIQKLLSNPSINLELRSAERHTAKSLAYTLGKTDIVSMITEREEQLKEREKEISKKYFENDTLTREESFKKWQEIEEQSKGKLLNSKPNSKITRDELLSKAKVMHVWHTAVKPSQDPYTGFLNTIVSNLENVAYLDRPPTKPEHINNHNYAGNYVEIPYLGYMEDPFLVKGSGKDKEPVISIANEFFERLKIKIKEEPKCDLGKPKSEQTGQAEETSLYDMNIGFAHYRVKEDDQIKDIIIIAPSGYGKNQEEVWKRLQAVVEDMNKDDRGIYISLQTSYNLHWGKKSKLEDDVTYKSTLNPGKTTPYNSLHDELLQELLNTIYANKSDEMAPPEPIVPKPCSEKKIAQLGIKLKALYDDVQLIAVENAKLGKSIEGQQESNDKEMGREYCSRFPCKECMKAVPAYNAINSLGADALGKALKQEQFIRLNEIDSLKTKLLKEISILDNEIEKNTTLITRMKNLKPKFDQVQSQEKEIQKLEKDRINKEKDRAEKYSQFEKLIQEETEIIQVAEKKLISYPSPLRNITAPDKNNPTDTSWFGGARSGNPETDKFATARIRQRHEEEERKSKATLQNPDNNNPDITQDQHSSFQKK